MPDVVAKGLQVANRLDHVLGLGHHGQGLGPPAVLDQVLVQQQPGFDGRLDELADGKLLLCSLK